MPEKFWFEDADGECIARDNLVIAFFAKCPFAAIVQGALYCVDSYFRVVPEDQLRWSIIGTSADSYKPLTPKALNRCRSMLTSSTAKQKDVHFRIRGPEPSGPDYSLIVSGLKAPSNEGFLDQANLIEMRFPRGFLAERGEDVFSEMVVDLFEHLPCDSGYASLSLCYGMATQYRQAGAHIAPLAFRSHGFDVSENLNTSNELGDLCRGARWLTILSNRLISELGGENALKEQLLDGVEILQSKHGVVLRAGRSPEIGDVNRNQSTPLVASVAHAIEGVTYFGDDALLPLFGDDEERRDRWEHRFWRNE